MPLRKMKLILLSVSLPSPLSPPSLSAVSSALWTKYSPPENWWFAQHESFVSNAIEL